MDKNVSEVGKKDYCELCGLFRRQALEYDVAKIG